MGRKRTGTAYAKRNTIYLRITLRDGKPWPRPWPDGDPSNPVHMAQAKAAAVQWQLDYDAGRAPDPRDATTPSTGETLESYALKRWCPSRELRGLRSVRDDRSRLKHWILPVLGPKRVTELARADLVAFRDALDGHVREESISWKTAENIWLVLTKLCDDLANGKPESLVVRADNPCASVKGPDRGDPKSKAYLYPSEAEALFACETAGPLEFIEAVAVATYAYLRVGELAALSCEDVDLEHDDIHVHRAMDRKTGDIRECKTAAGNRHVPIEPAVRPLLVRLIARRGGTGLLFPSLPPEREASKMLRAALRAAGCTREALYADDATRKNITFHDLRATGITWCAVRGDDDVKIQRRAGHTTNATTDLYIRVADDRRAGFGAPFPPLPSRLVGTSDSATGFSYPRPTETHSTAENTRRDVVPAAGVEPSRAVSDRSTPSQTAIVSANGSHTVADRAASQRDSATAVAESLAGLDLPELYYRCLVIEHGGEGLPS